MSNAIVQIFVFMVSTSTMALEKPVDKLPVVLKEGSQGRQVELLHRELNAKLDPSPSLVVDDHFGPLTTATIKQFQKRAGIDANGVVNEQTKSALIAAPTIVDDDSKTKDQQVDVDRYFSESVGTTGKVGPKVITRNLIQDSKGVFWLATWQGILQFDGETFTNVTNQERLRRYRAFSLLEDRQKNVWLGTTGAGVYRYDGKSYTNFTTKDGLVNDTILAMMQDRDGNIWFGSMGATKYDGKTFTPFDEGDGFTSRDVNSISQAPDGSIWFGSRGALFNYDGKSFVNFTKKHSLDLHPHSYIPTLFDRNGHLWFGGENGIYHYDGKKLQHVFEQSSHTLFEDSRGNIWFTGGALKGDNEAKPGISILNRFDPSAGLDNILTARTQFEISGGRGIFGITEDRDGNIWFSSGRGIGRIDGKSVRYY